MAIRKSVLIALMIIGCGAPPARMPLAVVVRGDAAEVEHARATLRVLENVDVRIADPSAPLAIEVGPADVETVLDRVRAAYDAANAAQCIAPIEDPSLVSKLLAANRRDAASRVLFWRAACHLLKGDEAGARTAARTFAALDLGIPSEKSDPAVPRILNDAVLEASRAPAAIVNVISAGPELAVSFDGRTNVCTTPCPITTRAGAHTIHVEADGRSPEDRDIALGATPVDARFDPPAASPELAAKQWVSRWAASPSIDAAPSMHLLADATRARNLVLVVAQGGTRPSLRAVFAIDGVVKSRAEKENAPGASAPAIVRELLVDAHVIESSAIYKRPLFWIALAVVAGAAVGLTYYLTTLPHTARVNL